MALVSHDRTTNVHVTSGGLGMSGEWEVGTLSDVLTLQRGFDLPEASRLHGSVPIVASTGIVGGHELSKVSGPGVVIGRSGSIGGGQYIVKDFWPLNTTLYVKDFKGNDVRFCYYALRSIDFQQFNVGSGVPTLNRNHIASLSIAIPPLPEQRRIAKILGDLDDKIELNRKMNETLEQMARALFKSWFVDFDPVRAKMEGRTPTGMDAATAALFPDRLVDSELGLIPEGWEVKALGEVAVNPRRSIKPSAFSVDTAYIGLEHIPKRSIALADWTSAESVASGKSQFSKGEILFGKLRPYFHKVGVAPIDGVCSTDILVIGPKSSEWFGFVLGHVSSDELVQSVDKASTGTRMPRASWSDIESYQAVIPDSRLASSFNEYLNPIINQITNNIHQSRTLSTLRDTLLPKLVSGEVRVRVGD